MKRRQLGANGRRAAGFAAFGDSGPHETTWRPYRGRESNDGTWPERDARGFRRFSPALKPKEDGASLVLLLLLPAEGLSAR
jgi:hypothetical protein